MAAAIGVRSDYTSADLRQLARRIGDGDQVRRLDVWSRDLMVHYSAGMEGCTMGQVLHGSARTTAAVRRAIQDNQESLRTLAKRHGINPKTVAKWRQRRTLADHKTGRKEPRSTVLSIEEEAIVAFRRRTLLSLDDCLYALQVRWSRLLGQFGG